MTAPIASHPPSSGHDRSARPPDGALPRDPRLPWERGAYRLARAAFVRGDGAMAEWRAWVRWIWWRQHRTPRSRVKALALAATLPVRALVAAAGALRVHGAAARAASGVGLARQAARQLWLRLAHGIGPATFYACQLYRAERWRRARSFADHGDTEILLRDLLPRGPREGSAIFLDKRRFEEWCMANQFPTVAALLEFEGGTLTRSTVADGGLPFSDLFVKPAGEAGGRGVERWAYDGRGRWTGGDGATCDAEELVARLARESAAAGRGLIVQRFLQNHPALAPLTSGGLCTMRMITVRPVDGGAPRLLLAVYRMVVGGAAADNFNPGAVAAAIDVGSGRLAPGVRRHPAIPYLVQPIDRHPDTGAAIEGHVVPYWAEAVDLVLRAHAAASGLVPVVGWDVAVLPDGPVLVEGNNVPGAMMSQTAPGVGYGETPYVPLLLAYFRAYLA